MTPVLPLPSYDQDYLREQSPAGLIVLMIENEDRVPRNVIDECARRGDAMAEALAPMAKSAGEAKKSPGWHEPTRALFAGLEGSSIRPSSTRE